MMGTVIHSNGSKWAGQDPDPIETLIEVLAREPLDPTFEQYGNFATNADVGSATIHFFGNFFGYSHVFRIDSDEAAVCATLIAAIRANQATAAYAEARRICQERATQHLIEVRRRRRR